MLRTATLTLLGLRVAYGAGLIAAPERLTRRWLGPAAGAPPTQVPLRGMGAREIVVHGAAIAAALQRPARCARSWPPAPRATSPTSLATVARPPRAARGSAPATLAVAGGSALLTAGLAAAVDR